MSDETLEYTVSDRIRGTFLGVFEEERWLFGGVVLRRATRAFWFVQAVLEADESGSSVCRHLRQWP